MAAAGQTMAVMTRPLRRAHWQIWIVLPLLLIAVLIVGLIARRPTVPVNMNLHWESSP